MKKLIYQNLLVTLCIFVVFFVVDLVVELLFAIPFNMNLVLTAAKSAGFRAVSLMLLMGIFQAIYIRKSKISLADFGINPTQSAIFSVDKSIAETKEIMDQMLPNKISAGKFRYDKEQDLYKARTRTSFISWGEMIFIKLTELGHSKVQLYVLSKPALRTTLVDFGKSAVNVQKIKRVFEQA